MHVFTLSRVQLFVTSWTVAHQAPLSMGFLRQEYWRRLPFFYSRVLPDPGLKPTSLGRILHWQVGCLHLCQLGISG